MTARRLGTRTEPTGASRGDVAVLSNGLGTTFFSIERVEVDSAGVTVAYHLKPLGSFDAATRVEANRISAILPNILKP